MELLLAKISTFPPFRVSNPVLIHFKRPIDTIFPFSLLKVWIVLGRAYVFRVPRKKLFIECNFSFVAANAAIWSLYKYSIHSQSQLKFILVHSKRAVLLHTDSRWDFLCFLRDSQPKNFHLRLSAILLVAFQNTTDHAWFRQTVSDMFSFSTFIASKDNFKIQVT